jgi:hypothetical protein
MYKSLSKTKKTLYTLIILNLNLFLKKYYIWSKNKINIWIYLNEKKNYTYLYSRTLKKQHNVIIFNKIIMLDLFLGIQNIFLIILNTKLSRHINKTKTTTIK